MRARIWAAREEDPWTQSRQRRDHHPDAARKGLDDLVPQVKAAPGFVAAYWVRLNAHGTSVAVFESEAQARAAAPQADATHRASP